MYLLFSMQKGWTSEHEFCNFNILIYLKKKVLHLVIVFKKSNLLAFKIGATYRTLNHAVPEHGEIMFFSSMPQRAPNMHTFK